MTLIGLAAKNAILIVEFVNQQYAAGESLKDAALDASRLRFRPIVMTSMAFILGVFPLAGASGTGAASRNSIGAGVFGGMLAATFLAIFFVPLFLRLLERSLGEANVQRLKPGRLQLTTSLPKKSNPDLAPILVVIPQLCSMPNLLVYQHRHLGIQRY